jgi:hypothetical protein
MNERRMRNRYAFDRVRPRTPKEKKTLLIIAASVLGAVLIAGGLHEVVKQSQRIRERTWITADGTVKNVRGVLVGQSGAYRAGMLYNVQVLVDYSLHGAKESRWITVGQPATGRAGLDFNRRLWKGRHCLVLLNPKNAEQGEVEFSKE